MPPYALTLAWGDTPAETLYILEGVAEAFIQSYQERGRERGGLPAGWRHAFQPVRPSANARKRPPCCLWMSGQKL